MRIAENRKGVECRFFAATDRLFTTLLAAATQFPKSESPFSNSESSSLALNHFSATVMPLWAT
jgi:hypothetical protein